MLKLIVAHNARRTGALLGELLEERGVELTNSYERADGLVSYGVRLDVGDMPALNANAGHVDKLQELQTLRDAGVRVPRFWEINGNIPLGEGHRFVARKRDHMGGRDVRLTTTARGLRIRRARGWDYLTEFIPNDREFRVWIYRRRHLRTYEKVRTRQVRVHRLKALARNHKNGYGFFLVNSEDVPRAAVEQAIAAIEAMQLDFGAVDIVLGRDRRFYVLEVNTAPGVEEIRESITALADKIVRWEARDFPTNRRDRG